MMTKMPKPVAAQPRLLIKLPTMHGIVNQEIRNVSDNQAACRPAGNLDVAKEREKEKEGTKADGAYPNRRPNEITSTGVVHPMEVPEDWSLMVDETMHKIFSERPKHGSTCRCEPPARVQSNAAAVNIIEQQSTDNDRVNKQLGVVTDPGLVLHHTHHCVPSETFRSPADLQTLKTACY